VVASPPGLYPSPPAPLVASPSAGDLLLIA
jgi:hypothetical protein